MAKVKIAVIGGGSYMWAPIFLRDIVMTKELSGSQVFLDDINPEALKLTTALGKKIAKDIRANISIQAARDKEEALDGADFVILTISTGGLETMRNDIEIPEKYGIFQSVGDTCGPGGISRALRNIPVVVEIAKKMEVMCPDAYLMNYTNPLATLTRAVRRETKIKSVGFCHELFGTIDWLKQIFNVEDESRFDLEIFGINHLTWIVSLKLDGKDVFPQLQEFIDENKRFAPTQAFSDPTRSVFLSDGGVKFALFRAFGALPAAGDRHVCEFFPYFLTEKSFWGEAYGVKLTPIEYRYFWMENDKKRIENMLAGRESIRMTPSREAAASFISAVANNRREKLIINIPNGRIIPGLPSDAILEVFGYVSRRGIKGVPISGAPAAVMAILNYHILIHELTVLAAVTGDRKTALQAFLMDPLAREFDDAERMMEELLEANKEYLPQFFS
jgi:alpha-galactosidase/6-phospho-beta-glucosidase family protein